MPIFILPGGVMRAGSPGCLQEGVIDFICEKESATDAQERRHASWEWNSEQESARHTLGWGCRAGPGRRVACGQRDPGENLETVRNYQTIL